MLSSAMLDVYSEMGSYTAHFKAEIGSSALVCIPSEGRFNLPLRQAVAEGFS